MSEPRSLDDIGGTAGAKYLTAYPAMVLPPPGSENAFAIVTLLACLIVHPIIFRQTFTSYPPNYFGHRSGAPDAGGSPNASGVFGNRETRNGGAIKATVQAIGRRRVDERYAGNRRVKITIKGQPFGHDWGQRHKWRRKMR